MGTRADFYRGLDDMTWLGSIAWDGYPSGLPDAVLQARLRVDYEAAVAAMLAGREDATLPDQGWPWPWPDSRTTDYAYAWDPAGGQLMFCNFGRDWCEMPTLDDPEGIVHDDPVEFPDMTGRARIAPPGDRRSGLITFVLGEDPE